MAVFYLPFTTAFGQNVRPSDGAKLYFYEAGTTTPKAVYADFEETTPLSNPVIANASGRFSVIYASGILKAVLKDKNDVQVWEEDDLRPGGGIPALNLLGDFDSSTNGGDYPESGDTGDVYRVTEKFVLNVQSGSHQLYVYDFIVANKNGAVDIDADWNILKGEDWLIDEDDFVSDDATLAPSQQSTKVYIASQILDEDDFASDSATKAPSQQSTKKFIEDGTSTFTNKTFDSADNTTTLDGTDANTEIEYVDSVKDAESDGRLLFFKKAIGAWDMDAVASVDIVFSGLAFNSDRIIHSSVTIINDSEGLNHPLNHSIDAMSVAGNWYFDDSGNKFVLTRHAGELFDSTSYNDTNINRGFVYVVYNGTP